MCENCNIHSSHVAYIISSCFITNLFVHCTETKAQGTATDAEASIKYWETSVLNKFTDEELENRETGDFGGVQGHIVGGLFVTWFIGFISMAFGKEIVHKVSDIW